MPHMDKQWANFYAKYLTLNAERRLRCACALTQFCCTAGKSILMFLNVSFPCERLAPHQWVHVFSSRAASNQTLHGGTGPMVAVYFAQQHWPLSRHIKWQSATWVEWLNIQYTLWLFTIWNIQYFFLGGGGGYFFLVGWLVVFNVPSTARSFRDGTPIYCPLRRTWSSINTLGNWTRGRRMAVHYVTAVLRKLHWGGGGGGGGGVLKTEANQHLNY